IQRAWRACTSRRESWQGQGEDRDSQSRGETEPPEGLQDPVVTTGISPGSSPSLAEFIRIYAQSSWPESDNEIPGGERSSVKSRGGQQKGGE
ncbi:hypothetical protein KUCAC02_005803, partial [Chaenocephalus aceratus]